MPIRAYADVFTASFELNSILWFELISNYSKICYTYLKIPFIYFRITLVTNNDIFRRVRFIFNFNDSTMIAIFGLADCAVTREQVSAWLKQDDKPDYQELSDNQLAIFLNGLISKKRGKKDGAQPEAENFLNNNMIFRKLKIAFDFKDDDIIETMELAGFPVSKHELSAFFRKSDHKNYRNCQSQILRNFLKGLQLKYRADVSGDNSDEPIDDAPSGS